MTLCIQLYSVVFSLYSLCIRFVFRTKKFRLGEKTSTCYIFHYIAPGSIPAEVFKVAFGLSGPGSLRKS